MTPDNKSQEGARNALNPSYAGVGLNTEDTINSVVKGALTYALNAQIESFSGEAITYQNEVGNIGCLTFPEGFRVMGVKNIPQKLFTMFMLASPSTGNSQIGVVKDGSCKYEVVIDDSKQDHKLGFSIDYPILQVEVKTTDCSTRAYWTDRKNPRRYIDFDNLPWKEEKNPDNDYKPTILVGQLDVNKMLVQPKFSIPSVKATKVIQGGVLKMGTYQAIIQYSNVLGEGFTSFYNASNPLEIYENKATQSFDLPTSKAIVYQVENLDTSGLYDYFNLVIVKNINSIVSFELVGKGLSISSSRYTYTYTGNETGVEAITAEEIFQKYKYYDTAKGSFTIDNVLGWYGLASPVDINHQEIWSAVELMWESHQIPYNKFEGYTNPINTQDYRGWMRDEVYAVSGCFLYDDGREGKACPIFGRIATGGDRLPVPVGNLDAAATLINPCDEQEGKEWWEVYNTATLEGYCPEFLEYKGDPSCYKGPYQYGKMAYWESDKLVPNNPLIWGAMANKPIRHPKMPDSTITHIHDNGGNFIYPLGIKVVGLQEAIKNSSLPQSEKDRIVGFKILRGNRTENKSIIAKGLFNNVGKYTFLPEDGNDRESQTYYFPNYPYNDLRPDPYFTKTKVKDHTGYRPDARLNGFADDDPRSRLTFHSPDTSFNKPFGIDSGQVKIETIEYGTSYGHFVPVDENAEYLFINRNGYKFAYGAGIASTVNGTVTYTTPWDYGIGANFTPENFAPSFQAFLDILNKVLPYHNFGYAHHSYGKYDNFVVVPNEGNKVRNINYGRYLDSEYQQIENGHTINNFQRESSVYINTTENLLYPHEYDSKIPQDNSRYHLSSYLDVSLWDKFFPVFDNNKHVVQDDDIALSIVNSVFKGPDVISFNFLGLSIAAIPSIGDTFEYTDYLGAPVAGLQVIAESHVLSSTPLSYNGTITCIVTSGTIDQINSNLVLQANSSALGSASAVFDYSNPNGDRLVKVSSSSIFPYLNFNTASESSYYFFIAFNTARLLAEIPKVFAEFNTVASEADLEALNVTNPSTIDDFRKLIAYAAYTEAFVRYQQDNSVKGSPDKIRESAICSYYGSIKKVVPDQWGAIDSYELQDTGFFHRLKDDNGVPYSSFPTVFGGDTFINRFALKTKLPVFEDNTVKDDDGTNIELDKIANLTYPMFWFSTSPVDHKTSITAFIEKKARQIVNNGATLDAFQTMLAGLYSIELVYELLKEILAYLGVRNINLDNFESADLYEKGLIYMFIYGIPYFFVESDVNVEYRHATNEREGNFYPNVSGDIPDEWLQEANVSIAQDNVYSYNESYYKTNKEHFYSRLRADYDPNKTCFFDFPNRAIWAEKSNLEETRDHWLTYRPASYFDLPKSHGALTSIDGIENRQLLVRFDSKTQLYNALTTVEVSNGPKAYLGSSQLFSGQPLDLSNTDGGHGGSQHVFFLRTEFGNISIDAKRGQIILLSGNDGGVDIAEKGMDKWFASHLPFQLTNHFDIPIDNALNGIGLTGVYDTLYKRVIITKKDYIPLVDNISYKNGIFTLAGKEISLTDSRYFCDKSWTASYSFTTQSWISFHSYTPSFYVPFPNYFQSGTPGSLWIHNRSTTLFNSYNGVLYPYVLEYPVSYALQDEIVQSVADYCTAIKYQDDTLSYEPEGVIYFNKAILYNRQQNSGLRNLVPRPKNSLATYNKYPKYNTDSIDILVTKKDHLYKFNAIHDIQKSPSLPAFIENCSGIHSDKVLNNNALDYSVRSYKKPNLRAKDLKIRLILDNRNDVKLISRFLLSPSTPSII